MMRVEGDLHVMLNRHCGHAQSVDCWCEPNRIYLSTVQGLPGITKVIEHNDESNEHHLVTLNKRERDRELDLPNEPGAPWITRVLSLPSPPALPPHTEE
jgi:hypothetical protein